MSTLVRWCSVLALAVALPAAAQSAPGQTAPDPAAPAPVDAPARTAPLGEASPLGVSLSLRLGWAIPKGDAFETTSGRKPLDGEFSGQLVLLHGDAGLRLWRRFVIGGYLEFGYPFVVKHGDGVAAQQCNAPGITSCGGSIYSVRLGVQALVKLLVDRVVEPWVGVGTGFESTSYVMSTERASEAETVSVEGWEFLNLQAGADWRVASFLRVGPYASLSMGRYHNTGVQAVTIEQRTIHQWVQLGARATIEGDFR